MRRDPPAPRPMKRLPAAMARQRVFCARHDRHYPAWQLADGRAVAGTCLACDMDREAAHKPQGEGDHG